MHLGLFRREHLQSDDPRLIGQATADQFQRSHGALQAWAESEHKDDGSHGAIHADSIDVTGGVAVGGDGLFKGDVIARDQSGDDCGLGYLPTVNSVPVLPGEVVRQAMLLGGPLTGCFMEWRGAQSPFLSGRELAIWNLGFSTLFPMLRIGVLSGTVVIIDGAGGAAPLNLGDLTEPINTLWATNVRAVAGGSSTFTHDSTRDSAAFDKGLVPITTGTQDLGWTNGLSYHRWRSLLLSAGVFEYNRTFAQGVYQGVPFAAGNYTANGAMTWVMAAGHQLAYRYCVIGKLMFIDYVFEGGVIGGTPNTLLMIATPGGFNFSSATCINKPARAIDGSGFVDCRCQVIDGGRWGFAKNNNTAFTAGVTSFYGTFIGSIN